MRLFIYVLDYMLVYQVQPSLKITVIIFATNNKYNCSEATPSAQTSIHLKKLQRIILKLKADKLKPLTSWVLFKRLLNFSKCLYRRYKGLRIKMTREIETAPVV